MLSQALPSRARLLLLPYARSAHQLPVLGLCGLSSHAAVPAPYGEHHQQRNEEGKAVKITVWWDFQMCRLPPGVSPFRVGSRVTAALRGVGIRGPVEINAFGDVSLLSRNEQEALDATGVTFSHAPSAFGVKNSCDRSFMADLIYWIAQNPPPAHFFLISGDTEFANILHRLQMSNYNVLLACPEVGSKTLHSAATIMWSWEALVKGVDLTPKHVIQPPDSLSSSWYGHYSGPVDMQLLKSEDSTVLPWNTWVPRVPKSVINGIMKVLRVYPEGISLPNLLEELERANVPMDSRGFFGYRKFAALLQAMPHVVKFIGPLPGDTQPAVVGVFKRSVEPSEQELDEKASTRRSNQEKHLSNKTESEELSSSVSQSSSSELSSCRQKKTLEAATPSPSNKLSSSQRKTLDLTTRAEPHSNCVEAVVSLATDAPSSDALSRDCRNAQGVNLATQTEPHISHTADMVAAAGAPTSGAQGNIGKKGLFGRILSLWSGPAH
ncbi:hypothetical protein QOZ80_9AG0675930 [Eleusine coracana subsp. coracana]|nr:hypothetical protein QOZ80_9AG0675930 [Eleusine coracana subsp. coracana]